TSFLIASATPRKRMIIEREEIEGEKAHVATVPVALLEDRLNALMPVSRAGFTVKHGRVYRPRERLEPGHARMAQQIAAWAAVARHGAAVADVDLGPLPIELGLGDVAAL